MDSQSINRVFKVFKWEKMFQNKVIHEELKRFNETIPDVVLTNIKPVATKTLSGLMVAHYVSDKNNRKIFKRHRKDGRVHSDYKS